MKSLMFCMILIHIIINVSGLLTPKIDSKYGERVNALRRQRPQTFTKDVDPSKLSVYYSVSTKQALNKVMGSPYRKPGQSLRIPFLGDPCTCNGLQCSCCANIRLPFGFNRQTCANVTWVPETLGITLDILVDNYTIQHNEFSARNPPAFCIPVAALGILGPVSLCIKLTDIYFSGSNLHMCIDFETRISGATILVLHFDCVILGPSGVSFVKPDNTTSIVVVNNEEMTETVVYNEVTEVIRGDTTTIEDVAYETTTLKFSEDNEDTTVFEYLTTSDSTTFETREDISTTIESTTEIPATSTTQFMEYDEDNSINTESINWMENFESLKIIN